MAALVDSTGDVSSLQRYIPRRSINKSTRRRTLNHRVRLAAKQYDTGDGTDYLCEQLGLPCQEEDPWALPSPGNTEPRRIHADPTARRQHLENDLRHLHCKSSDGLRLSRRGYRKEHWDKSDSLELARSGEPLPCDRHRTPGRRVSLDRQDAFCDADTFKGNVHVRKHPAMPVGDDAQVAELYRMGLLYDKEETARKEESFGLNNIHHEQPVYTLRHARRGRRQNKTRSGADNQLNLNLSFTDLGRDADLARYLTSTPESTSDDASQHSSRRHFRKASAPLRVIYELASSQPSFDVDTSQPPDLVDDNLSDYDCFSDGELDEDMPSQREIYDGDGATSASGAWVILGDDS